MRQCLTLMIPCLLIACGGSQDVCQRSLSLLQAEDAKVKSCGGDDSSLVADIAAVQGGEQICEASLKNCTSADLSSINSALDCQGSLDSTIQCKWFTEMDATNDPTFQTYETNSQTCTAKAQGVTSTCATFGTD